MNFFKRLLIKSEDRQMMKMTKSIYDLFSFNLQFVPDFSFEKICDQVGKSGSISSLYLKNLDYMECGLFNVIEVRIYGEFDHKSISLINNKPETISVVTLEKLVNVCYEYYGYDNSYSPRGMFDEIDKAAIEKRLWCGRMWTAAHHRPGAMLLMDNERLEMVIWVKELAY